MDLFRKTVHCRFVLWGCLALAGPIRAHHSFSAFDMETELTLAGVVVEFAWTSPHTVTTLDVSNADGSLTRWVLEGMSPDYLGRRGWTRHTLAVGERIEVVVAPSRDGKPSGTFLRATLADGTRKIMFGGR